MDDTKLEIKKGKQENTTKNLCVFLQVEDGSYYTLNVESVSWSVTREIPDPYDIKYPVKTAATMTIIPRDNPHLDNLLGKDPSYDDSCTPKKFARITGKYIRDIEMMCESNGVIMKMTMKSVDQLLCSGVAGDVKQPFNTLYIKPGKAFTVTCKEHSIDHYKKNISKTVDKKIIDSVTKYAHDNQFVTDDIVDNYENVFTLRNGDECSMYDKFQQDLNDFIVYYIRNTKGNPNNPGDISNRGEDNA